MPDQTARLFIDAQMGMFTADDPLCQGASCLDTTCRRVHSTWANPHRKASQIIAHHNQTLGSGFVSLKTADEVRIAALQP